MPHGIVMFNDEEVGTFSTLGDGHESMLITFQTKKYQNILDLTSDSGAFLTLLDDPPILESDTDHDTPQRGSSAGEV